MGFISFNESYYRRKLETYEGKSLPFLYDTYRDKIFCRRYEDIRRFETVYSQDLLLQYSSYHGGMFFVKVSDDKLVQDRALSEIRKFAVYSAAPKA